MFHSYWLEIGSWYFANQSKYFLEMNALFRTWTSHSWLFMWFGDYDRKRFMFLVRKIVLFRNILMNWVLQSYHLTCWLCRLISFDTLTVQINHVSELAEFSIMLADSVYFHVNFLFYSHLSSIMCCILLAGNIFLLHGGDQFFCNSDDFSLHLVGVLPWNLPMKRLPDVSMHLLFCMSTEDLISHQWILRNHAFNGV